jgi:peptide/nickel transport system substrate-binding protein
LTIKYTINKDVKWSDGVPVSAADLLLAWASGSGQFNTEVLATDKDGNAINDASGVDKAVVAKVKKIADFWNTGFDATELPSDPSLYIGYGPYLLKEYKKDQYMTFTKNPNYTWGPIPSVDTITLRFIPDAMAMMQALKNGEVDVANPQATADVLGAAKQMESQGVKVLTGDGATYEHVDLAQNNGGPFDPKTYGGDAKKATDVRLAFLKTIPRQQIVDRLIKPLNPNAQLRDSFNVVPGSPAYDSTVAGNGMKDWDKVDIDGAKKLLADAGVKTPVKVRLMYAQGNTRRANEYKFIAESAKSAGFDVIDGANKDWGSLLSNTKVYDAALFGWQSTAIGASQIPPNFQTDGQNNFYGYSNKDVDALLKQLNSEPDIKKQDEINTKVEAQLLKDGFGVPIFQFPEIISFNTKRIQNVQGLSLSPGYFWNFWEWTAG